jgi:hypothetical protein
MTIKRRRETTSSETAILKKAKRISDKWIQESCQLYENQDEDDKWQLYPQVLREAIQYNQRIFQSRMSPVMSELKEATLDIKYQFDKYPEIPYCEWKVLSCSYPSGGAKKYYYEIHSVDVYRIRKELQTNKHKKY